MTKGTASRSGWRCLAALLSGLCFLLAATLLQAQTSSDFNNDKRADVIFRDVVTGDVALWSMNGLHRPDTRTICSGLSQQWQIAGAADFDGNGVGSILWRNATTGDVALWQFPNGGDWVGTVLYAGLSLDWQISGIGDVNGDGKADILWRNRVSGDVSLWLMDGQTVVNGVVIYPGAPLEWQIAGMGDTDGDGKADIFWRNVRTGDVALWLMDGQTIVDGMVICPEVALEWQIEGVGDFNGDRKADLIWRNTRTGDVAEWLMDGQTIVNGIVIYPGARITPGWQIVGTGDYDGDGKTDLLWYNTAFYYKHPEGWDWYGDVSVWLMNGEQPWYIWSGPPEWQAARPLHKVFGLDFSPYVGAGQDPNSGTPISSAQLTTLLTRIAPYTDWICTLGTTNGLENVGEIAHEYGLKTALGASLSGDAARSDAEIAGLVQQANAGSVDLAVVGNGNLLRGDLSEEQILAYIQQVRQQVPVGTKITYVDTWDQIVAHPNVMAAVDIVAVSIYPYGAGASVDSAISQLQSDYQATVDAAGGKPVWIMETGWPFSGGVANAGQYFCRAEQWARSAGIPLFYFEAYDQPWRPWGGIWDVNGNMNQTMNLPFH